MDTWKERANQNKINIIHRANLLNNKTTSLWYKLEKQDLETFNSLKHVYMTSVSKAIQENEHIKFNTRLR